MRAVLKSGVLFSSLFRLVLLVPIFLSSHEETKEVPRKRVEKELIRKEADEQKRLDRETYPDLPREERLERDREIERVVRELF